MAIAAGMGWTGAFCDGPALCLHSRLYFLQWEGIGTFPGKRKSLSCAKSKRRDEKRGQQESGPHSSVLASRDY